MNCWNIQLNYLERGNSSSGLGARFPQISLPLQKISYKSENVFATIILLLEGDFKMKEKEYYKEQIIEMVQKIENQKYLAFLYDMMMSFKKKWGI